LRVVIAYSPAVAPELGDGLLGFIGSPAQMAHGALIALVASERAAVEVARSGSVGLLMPHDPDVCPSRWPCEPRAMVIQCSCGVEDGPWQHLGSPHAPDRAEQLVRLVRAARSRAIPVVAWIDGPRWQCAHALTGLGPLVEYSGDPSGIHGFLVRQGDQSTP
jgi:hypothetical protein